MIVEHCGNVHVTARHYQCMSIYRDFAEISWSPDYVNLQRFYGAPTTSIYRDFMRPDYVNLQIFYGVPTTSIYRDFMVPRLCQFIGISHDQVKPVKSS